MTRVKTSVSVLMHVIVIIMHLQFGEVPLTLTFYLIESVPF